MKNPVLALLVIGVLSGATAVGQPALTIYNQNFAVVRDTVPLDLKAGVNSVQFSGMTAHAEPDSVVLRDPTGKHPFQILEQNYRNDPVSQELLLSLCEGKTIDFQKTTYVNGQPEEQIIQGKIIRSGYVPHYQAMNRYGSQYYQSQMAYARNSSQPIIEVNGKLQFSLPGQPLFPALPDDTILKPTLLWLIQSARPAKFDAELGYLSEGMSWQASYNLVAPEKGDRIDLVGWVTIDNQSGKSFKDAKIKLMAGDVNKIQPRNQYRMIQGISGAFAAGGATPPVTQKAFDEYHLYTLHRPTTLLDRETKQVEFIHATGIESKTIYVYDGAQVPDVYPGGNYENIRYNRDYGTQCNPKVWVMREFVNSEKNHLGIPLPKGRLRFYRSDADGQLEFTGENTIDHTPKDETVRVLTGNAFDLVGERKQTSYHVENRRHVLDESFAIKLRNHKKQPVAIRVVEHLYRGDNWEITAHSDAFLKKDAHTIEFLVQVKPDEEKTVTYTVHYTW